MCTYAEKVKKRLRRLPANKNERSCRLVKSQITAVIGSFTDPEISIVNWVLAGLGYRCTIKYESIGPGLII